jgi:HlyD family secretion protein
MSRGRIRTATVVTGSIDAVITASGAVTPEIERMVSSPFDARVVRIIRRPGAMLRKGDAIAELDLGESILALERILTDVSITDNQQSQARLALDMSLAGIDSHINQKTLELQILETRAVSSMQLSIGGLVSAQTVQEATLAVKRAELELGELHTERVTAEQSTKLRFEGLALQRTALDKAANEARRVLDLATTRSDREGVLTWVLPQEGALVRKGDVIARIADLSSFRVDASVSAIHGGRIRTGVPVIVKINDTALEGTITDVLPTIENDVMRFMVRLGESSHPLLRPNLRVDVLVVFDRRPQALKVKQGPFSNGADADGAADVFLVHRDRAMRVPVRFGLRSSDEIEIVSGLHEGDEVVISDMRDYLHLEEIDIR